MKRFAYSAGALALVASFAAAQTAKTTLLVTSRYGTAESTDATADAILRKMVTHDIIGVTPGKDAQNNDQTAFKLFSSSNHSIRAGDPDNDGKVSVLPQSSIITYGWVGPFVKWDDKKNFDPRNVYMTVKYRTSSDQPIKVFANGQSYDVKTGDFIRIKDDGQAEFFITQALIMKAAGMQTGSWVNGAICMCQDKNKNLYYAGPHALTPSGTLAGGHWVANGAARQFLFDAGVAKIPASAITYDASGNVQDVTAGSTVVVFNEITNPTSQPNTRDLVDNSKHIDSQGKHDSVTFWMTGVDTDPTTTGTFKGWDGKDTPHLIFTIVRTPFSGNGSWKTTIFSTKDYQSQPGSVATINGVLMGSLTPTKFADGSWVGLKDNVASSSAPILGGLQWVEAGFNETAPYGSAGSDAAAHGVVTIGTDPRIDLAFQGPVRLFPTVLSFGGGVAKGGRLLGVDLSGVPSPVFGAYATFFQPTVGWTLFPGGSTNAKGEISFSFPTPNDNNFKGSNLVWQVLFFKVGGNWDVSPPTITDFR